MCAHDEFQVLNLQHRFSSMLESFLLLYIRVLGFLQSWTFCVRIYIVLFSMVYTITVHNENNNGESDGLDETVALGIN